MSVISAGFSHEAAEADNRGKALFKQCVAIAVDPDVLGGTEAVNEGTRIPACDVGYAFTTGTTWLRS